MQCEVRKKHDILWDEVIPLYLSEEKKTVDDNVSRIALSMDIMAEDKNSAMNVWPDYSIDTFIQKHLDRKVRSPFFKLLSMIQFGTPALKLVFVGSSHELQMERLLRLNE